MALTGLVLAKPRGFCAGVDRAIDIVEQALEVFDKPVYVRKEIVHNRHVVEALQEKGRGIRRGNFRNPGRRHRHLQRPRCRPQRLGRG